MPQVGTRGVHSRGQGDSVSVSTRQGHEEAALEPTEGPGRREALGAHARRPGRVSGCEGKAAGHRCTIPHRSKERRAKLTPGNYKMFLKETRGDLNEVRDIPCSWTTVLRCPPSPASTRPLSEAQLASLQKSTSRS